MAEIEPSKLGSAGKPGRITGPPGVSIHLDVIRRVSRSSRYERTETAVEKGAPLTVHRRRVPEPLVVEIVVTDTQPFAGASLIGRWEPDHARKTLERLREAQASDEELRVWDGENYYRTPAGTKVWVLDEISGPELEGAERGVLRATLTFGESPRFATQFTPAFPDTSEALADVTGDEAERGRQSTTDVDASDVDAVEAEVWP